MKKIAHSIAVLLFVVFTCNIDAQVNNKSVEHNVKILNEVNQKVYPIDFNFHPKTNTTSQKQASIILPLNQTICSGQNITSINASPSIDGSLNLNCRANASLEFLNVQNNGIFFDVSNLSGQTVRINGITIPLFTPVTTTSSTAVPFSIYKTTTATSAEGNYTSSANWTKIGDYIATLGSATAGNGFAVRIELADFGFTLNPSESKGVYVVVTTPINGFKVGYRNLTSTPASFNDSFLSLINKANSNGLFNTNPSDNYRGFFGNIYYQTGTYGFWSRNNATLVTGTGTAGANFSNTTPFPISGTLTNNSADTQITNYNITAYNINGVREDHIAEVTVVTSTVINTVTQNGNSLTADQDGASYQWFDCNNGNAPIVGATQQTFTPITSGNYGVTITLSPCQSTNSSCTNLLSKGEFTLEEFKFYPNPTSGEIKYKSMLDFDLKIINQMGQLLFTLPIQASNIEKMIQLNQLQTGIYFLTGNSKDGKTLNKKIIITN